MPGIGTAMGWALGSMVGGLLEPKQGQQGPRISDLKLQGSSYGSFIGIPYGTVRIAGDVIWQTDLVEHSQTEGGKGGPEVTSYTYTASFAIQICEGPIDNITKIWADARLIYDRTPGAATSALPLAIYLGDESQLPDPTIEAVEGAGNVPAHRGTAYVVFTDFALADYGNRIPLCSFQVQTVGLASTPIHLIKFHSDSNSPPIIWEGSALRRGIKPIVTAWPGTGEVRVKGSGTVEVAVYDADGLQYLRTDYADTILDRTIDTQVLRQEHHLHNEWRYYAVGLYYIDGELVPVWASAESPVGPGRQFPALAGTAVYLDDSEIPISPNSFASSAGIPLGEYIGAAVLTQDQTALFVFTAPSITTPNFPIIDKWYKLVNAIVVEHGAVDPPLPASSLGFGAQQSNSYNALQFENNCKWCWWMYGAGLGNCWPHVYQLENGNFFASPTATALVLNSTLADSLGLAWTEEQTFNYPSCMVLQDGYCGVVFGKTLAVVSRFPIDDSLDVTLGSIVGDISERCGLAAEDYNAAALTDRVAGYTIGSPMDGRAAIAALQPIYFFDGVESDGAVKFVRRGGEPVATIDVDELAAVEYGGALPSIFEIVRGAESELPASVTLTYINPDADYQTSAQQQRRNVGGQSVVTVEAAVVLADKKAKQVVDALLFHPWFERDRRTFQTSRKYLSLDPTDVVSIEGRHLRITQKTETAEGLIKFTALPSLSAIYAQSSVGGVAGGFVPPVVVGGSSQATQLLLLDIPLVDDDDAEGFYVAMAGTATGWRGASLYRSSDGGSSYAEIAHTSAADTIGTASSVLGDFLGGNAFDEGNSVTVALSSGTLSSSTAAGVANGSNKALLGREILQYRTATLIAANTYMLTGLLRGRRGTEWAIGTHGSDERFVGLPTSINIASAELNVSRLYKAVTFGRTLASAPAVEFANTGAAVRPYSVVDIGGGFDASNNCTINWVRRTRIGGEWVGYVDVPLSEASELYTVEIWDSAFASLKRTISGITSPTTLYSAAQQVADFGSTQAIVYAKVYQNGRLLPSRGVRCHFPNNPQPTWTSDLEPTPGRIPPPAALRTIPLAWPATDFVTQAYSEQFGGFAADESISVSFTTAGASSSGIGRISLVEFSDPPVERIACLSTVSGDFETGLVGQPFSKQVGIGIAFRFTVGVSAPYAIRLAPSTTYFLNLRNGATGYSSCNIQLTLQKPSGGL